MDESRKMLEGMKKNSGCVIKVLFVKYLFKVIYERIAVENYIVWKKN